jgi:hypothetical protein
MAMAFPPTADQVRPATSRPGHEEDSDSREDSWESKVVRLDPDATWSKPPHTALLLTSASICLSPGDPPDRQGVLVAETFTYSVSICVLLKNIPVQRLKLVWRPDQDITFTNHGNRFITITLLTKRSFMYSESSCANSFRPIERNG